MGGMNRATRLYFDRIRDYGCIICRQEAVIHHVMSDVPGKVGRRDDRFVIPLCPTHHNMGNDSVHLLGSERKFEQVHGVNIPTVAVMLRERFG